VSSNGPPPGERAGLRRVDDRLGLAVCRASLSARTLVTYARDHVTVRTPSRPDFHDGNTLDLVASPAADDLEGWVGRFRETIGQLGVATVQVRWEEPPPSGTGADVGVPAPDATLAGAAAALGLSLHATTVQLLTRLSDPPPTDVDIAPIAPPSAVPGGAVDRRWHAATVLYRYQRGDTPDQWREHDEGSVAWAVDVQRELAAAERAQVWVATRHGAPVGRLTLVHDRQGLAVVEDVIVHPVHRRRGIAAALTAKAVATHLAVWPDSRVGIGATPGTSAERIQRRLGFVPHATVWTARGG
jgi:GNAT superfamily N-acetyltransferase